MPAGRPCKSLAASYREIQSVKTTYHIIRPLIIFCFDGVLCIIFFEVDFITKTFRNHVQKQSPIRNRIEIDSPVSCFFPAGNDRFFPVNTCGKPLPGSNPSREYSKSISFVCYPGILRRRKDRNLK
jgi:hypothetical protein